MPDQLEDRLKKLIVETLALEDVSPEEIETDAPLFGEGLGLDSIDALELALAIHSEFGVRTEENDPQNREHYQSVASLANFVRTKQAALAAPDAESGGTTTPPTSSPTSPPTSDPE